ncbi:hypothetical protein Tco_1360701 [Tanacetum coccineum]
MHPCFTIHHSLPSLFTYMQNEASRLHILLIYAAPFLEQGQRGASDITAGHVGNRSSLSLVGRAWGLESDPRAQMDGFGIKG